MKKIHIYTLLYLFIAASFIHAAETPISNVEDQISPFIDLATAQFDRWSHALDNNQKKLNKMNIFIDVLNNRSVNFYCNGINEKPTYTITNLSLDQNNRENQITQAIVPCVDNNDSLSNEEQSQTSKERARFLIHAHFLLHEQAEYMKGVLADLHKQLDDHKK